MIWFQKRWQEEALLIYTHICMYYKIEKWNITIEKKRHIIGELVIDDNWLRAGETHWLEYVSTNVYTKYCMVLSPLQAKTTRGHLEEEPCFARYPGWLKWKQPSTIKIKHTHTFALNSCTPPTCGSCTIWPDWLNLELFAPKRSDYSSINSR